MSVSKAGVLILPHLKVPLYQILVEELNEIGHLEVFYTVPQCVPDVD